MLVGFVWTKFFKVTGIESEAHPSWVIHVEAECFWRALVFYKLLQLSKSVVPPFGNLI